MNVTEFMACSRRTFKKAKALEREILERSERARAEGRERKAEELLAIAERAVPAAEAYLESLHVEGV